MIYVLSGSGLDLKVVNGTSAPAAPKENTLWVNTSTAVHTWDFSPEQPYLRSKNKNLIPYPYYESSKTSNGITFTVNSDGSITVNGTASAGANFGISASGNRKQIYLQPGTYVLSGGGSSACPVTVRYSYDNWGSYQQASSYTGAISFTLDKPATAFVYIWVNSGVVLNNAIYKPQLEKGSTATSFAKGDASGQVWIQTGESGKVNFNALKKNGIWQNIKSVKQYSGGAWLNRAAKFYQGGAWTDLPAELLLFDSTVTSGWAAKLYDANSCSGGIVNGKLVVKGGTPAFSNALLYKETVVSTSGYTNVKITVDSVKTANGTGNQHASLILQTSPALGSVTAQATAAARLALTGAGTFSLKLPTGTYYVGIELGQNEVTVSKIWFE